MLMIFCMFIHPSWLPNSNTITPPSPALHLVVLSVLISLLNTWFLIPLFVRLYVKLTDLRPVCCACSLSAHVVVSWWWSLPGFWVFARLLLLAATFFLICLRLLTGCLPDCLPGALNSDQAESLFTPPALFPSQAFESRWLLPESQIFHSTLLTFVQAVDFKLPS